VACELSNYEIVSILCENGADIFAQNSNLKTPFTSVSNNLLMVKMLKKQEKAFFEKNI